MAEHKFEGMSRQLDGRLYVNRDSDIRHEFSNV